MEHKEAADILIKMSEKPHISDEEREAVLTAVGVLAWTSLAKNRFKSKRDKNIQSK